MLPGGDGGLYRSVVASGGGEYVRRVEVWRQGVRIDPFGQDGLPLNGGSVTIGLRSRVTRTVDLTIPATDSRYRNGATLIPWSGGDLLDPLGNELRIWAGWRSGGWVGWWQVFRGPIVGTLAESGSGVLRIEGADLCERIIADDFVSSRASNAGVLVLDEFRDLITDAMPDAVFGVSNATPTKVPVATWSGRAQALDALASASNAHWYTLADGSFVLRTVPWSVDAYGAPAVVWSVDTGLVSSTVAHTREQVSNVVVVSSSTADASDPVVGVARDESDTTSRTYLYGPLGGRVLKQSAQQVPTLAAAQGLARQLLRRSRSTVEEWSATVTCDPSIELGDVCEIRDHGVVRRLAVMSLNLPLVGEPVMSMELRTAGSDIDD